MDCDVTKPTENLESVQAFWPVYSNSRDNRSVRLLLVQGKTGCVQCGWSAGLGGYTTADWERD